jgi:hypothetical protein
MADAAKTKKSDDLFIDDPSDALIGQLPKSSPTDSDSASSVKPDEALRNLVPFHKAKGTGSRGRPRKIETTPAAEALLYHQQVAEAKAKLIQQDPVVQAAESRLDALQVLHLLKLEIAKEGAAIQATRLEMDKLGKDTGQLSTRRIDALNKIAHIELEIKKIGVEMVDLRSERFQRVFALWIEMIQLVAEEVLDPEQSELFFNRLGTAMEGWEDRASEAMAGKD